MLKVRDAPDIRLAGRIIRSFFKIRYPAGYPPAGRIPDTSNMAGYLAGYPATLLNVTMIIYYFSSKHCFAIVFFLFF
jgi:hypothetical protein